jgi:capsular exopolysaccharide synthesis family protein
MTDAADAAPAPRLGETTRAVAHPVDSVMAAVLSSTSPVSEEFRILLAKIRTLGESRPLKTIGVVSACPGEGKTTVALGLALAMAQEPGRRVLLVEADLRNPAVERYLGLPQQAGLGEWLEGNDKRLRVRKLSPQGLCLLAAGRFKSQRPELLRSPRMAAVLAAAAEEFDAIVLDCPPLAPVSDSVLLQDLLDGLVVVVRARYAPIDAVRKAVGHLHAERVLGIVFNDQSEVLPARYKHGYGYGYGRYGAER